MQRICAVQFGYTQNHGSNRKDVMCESIPESGSVEVRFAGGSRGACAFKETYSVCLDVSNVKDGMDGPGLQIICTNITSTLPKFLKLNILRVSVSSSASASASACRPPIRYPSAHGTLRQLGRRQRGEVGRLGGRPVAPCT